MKRRETRFTLIELLVVIGIIAVLAGILLPTISIAIKKTHIAKARTEMGSLMAAITMYQSEYDVMPFPYITQESKKLDDSDLDDSSSVPYYTRLISFLSQTGTDEHKSEGNARKIKMLSVKKAATYLDPWDHPYHIVYDSNYDEEILVDDIVGLYDSGNTIPYTVVIWSAGPDEKYSSSNPKDTVNKDNVYTIETNWDSAKGHVIP